jgi:hypothetical protein
MTDTAGPRTAKRDFLAYALPLVPEVERPDFIEAVDDYTDFISGAATRRESQPDAVAALAEAIQSADVGDLAFGSNREWCEAVLAALPDGWHLVKGLECDCGGPEHAWLNTRRHKPSCPMYAATNQPPVEHEGEPTYRIRIRTPDDPDGWTAIAEGPVGQPYVYSTEGPITVVLMFSRRILGSSE